ncbi:MAG: hypothetical protein RL095_155 [Verrucomicrobiota bacterium]|jgi:hypothetical protein
MNYFKTTYAGLFSMAIFCSLPLMAGQRATDWEDVQRQAKTQPQAVAILLTGSDWNPPSPGALAEWNLPQMEKVSGNIRLLHIDHPNYPDAAAQQREKKNEELQLKHVVYSYPALVLKDKNGHYLATKESLQGAPGEIAKIMGEWRVMVEKYEAELAKVPAAKGVEKARQIGRALDVLPLNFAFEQDDLLKQLGEADPKDQTGYVYKYLQWERQAGGSRVGASARALGKKKNYKELNELIAYINVRLKNPVINTEQKQVLLAGTYAAYRFMPNTNEQQRQALTQIVKIDPSSIPGRGAQGLLQALDRAREAQKLQGILEKNPDDMATLKKFLTYSDVNDYGRLVYLDPKTLPSHQYLIDAKLSLSANGAEPKDQWLRHLVTNPKCSGYVTVPKGPDQWVQLDFSTVKDVERVLLSTNAQGKNIFSGVALETSQDGKTWTERGRTKEKEYSLDVALQGVKARYVRCRRVEGGKSLIVADFLAYSKNSKVDAAEEEDSEDSADAQNL